jgi:hypothetical protein
MFYSRIKETPRCPKDQFIPLKGIRMTARRTQSTTRLVARHRENSVAHNVTIPADRGAEKLRSCESP